MRAIRANCLVDVLYDPRELSFGNLLVTSALSNRQREFIQKIEDVIDINLGVTVSYNLVSNCVWRSPFLDDIPAEFARVKHAWMVPSFAIPKSSFPLRFTLAFSCFLPSFLCAGGGLAQNSLLTFQMKLENPVCVKGPCKGTGGCQASAKENDRPFTRSGDKGIKGREHNNKGSQRHSDSDCLGRNFEQAKALRHGYLCTAFRKPLAYHPLSG
jgi:hypothetical protein